MDSQATYGARIFRPRLIIAAAIILVGATVIAFLVFTSRTAQVSGLMPYLATPTPAAEMTSVASSLVSFTELNADPLAYLNRRVQVSGDYLPLAGPDCSRYSGPNIRWALVSEELQLDAMGFERIVRILQPGTGMTVEGIWRLYQGPLGCGKGPQRGSAWFLQVQRIIQPNPLIGAGVSNSIDIDSAALGLPALIPTDVATLTPTATPTIIPQTPTVPFSPTPLSVTSTVDSAAVGSPVPTNTSSAATSTATSTPVTTGGTPLPSATPAATSTSSSSGGGSSPTNTPSGSVPATSTQSSGNYPGPPTSTPTASPDPYA